MLNKYPNLKYMYEDSALLEAKDEGLDQEIIKRRLYLTMSPYVRSLHASSVRTLLMLSFYYPEILFGEEVLVSNEWLAQHTGFPIANFYLYHNTLCSEGILVRVDGKGCNRNAFILGIDMDEHIEVLKDEMGEVQFDIYESINFSDDECHRIKMVMDSIIRDVKIKRPSTLSIVTYLTHHTHAVSEYDSVNINVLAKHLQMASLTMYNTINDLSDNGYITRHQINGYKMTQAYIKFIEERIDVVAV